MVILHRKKPKTLRTLQALLPRLRPDFPRYSEIKQDEMNRRKGYEGEKKVDYYIEFLANQFTILQDLCLEVNRKEFQIDTLVISQKAIYIIEIKNLSDKVIFNTKLNQCIRSDGTVERGYKHPIVQAGNQQLLLELWLEQHKLTHIPVYYFVVFSNPSTIIEVVGDEEQISEVVTHAEHIAKKILEKDGKLNFSLKQRGQTIGKAMLKMNKEFEIDVINKYEIRLEDLLTGVHCPTCGTLGTMRGFGKWICRRCKKISKNAHTKSIADYFTLINPHITNRECRRFLNLKSKDITTRLLKTSSLVYDTRRRRWGRG